MIENVPFSSEAASVCPLKHEPCIGCVGGALGPVPSPGPGATGCPGSKGAMLHGACLSLTFAEQ